MVNLVEPQKSFFVTDWLDRRAKLSGDRIALHDALSGRDISYRAWNAIANRTANMLDSLGVQAGDRVAIYSTNCVEYLDLLMACNKTGAVLQVLNWRLAIPEMRVVLNDAAPVVLVYSDEFVSQVNTLRSDIPSVRRFVALNQLADSADLPFAERESCPTAWDKLPELHPDAPWVICYTGGTTGIPKGAILTHGNMTWNSVNAVMSVPLNQNDVFLLSMPLFHTGGLNIFTLPLFHVGGKVIVTKAFDVEKALDFIEQQQVTVYLAVPTMYALMQAHPRWETANFSSIKAMFSGGAPCPEPIYQKFWAKGVQQFRVSYGLTEGGPYNIWLPNHDIQRKPGAIGVPVFHADVRIVHEDGSLCVADEPGELITRGMHVIPGYWNNPDATAKTVVDGWLHTGDLARADDEGYIWVIGRIKDMIISGGENVYPAEIESVLMAHPDVAEAVVIGVPDDKWGEVGWAVVVAKGQITAEALTIFMSDRLAKYKVPKNVVFVDAIPKTAVGKIDKKAVAQKVLS
ncbi:MAG: long-chain fatty acid--CoA ligase [Chloroflexi bacterium]|nr:long-chain fatty acid--CoA ligase [Chloroflexota bacterium]